MPASDPLQRQPQQPDGGGLIWLAFIAIGVAIVVPLGVLLISGDSPTDSGDVSPLAAAGDVRGPRLDDNQIAWLRKLTIAMMLHVDKSASRRYLPDAPGSWRVALAQATGEYDPQDLADENGKTRLLLVTGPGTLFDRQYPKWGMPFTNHGPDRPNSSIPLLIVVGPDRAVDVESADDFVFNPDDPKAGLGNVDDPFLVIMADASIIDIPRSISPAAFTVLCQLDPQIDEETFAQIKPELERLGLPTESAQSRELQRLNDDISRNPELAVFRLARARYWRRADELDRALEDCNEAIRLDPQLVVAYINRGSIWKIKKEFDKAVEDYGKVISLIPHVAATYIERGSLLRGMKEFDKALVDFTEAIRLAPGEAAGYIHRGATWDDKHEYDNALKDYTEAIRLDPEDWVAFKLRAWLRATAPEARHRDGAQAVADALKACELTLKEKGAPANADDALAAAYAETGQFDLAVKWQTSAIEFLIDDDAEAEDIEEAREILERYQAGKPYRQENE